MRRAIALAVVAPAVLAVSGLAASRVHLTISKATPMTVRGAGFHRHEHVRVSVRRSNLISTRRVTATWGGSFTAAFPNAKVRRCEPFRITATGSRGSHAALVRRPACPPG